MNKLNQFNLAGKTALIIGLAEAGAGAYVNGTILTVGGGWMAR